MNCELNEVSDGRAGLGLPTDASVVHLLGPLMPFLDIPYVTEVVINNPYLVFVEKSSGWESYPVPSLSFEHCLSLAVAIASYTHQDISAERPVLSATLPGGQRIQIIIPPACPPDRVSITIRLPAHLTQTLEDYHDQGFFEQLVWSSRERYSRSNAFLDKLNATDRSLLLDLKQNRFCDFFEGAIRGRKNIAIVGDTGSGKTTFMKTLCQCISPEDRLVTIEDVREIMLPNHPNCVHLLYSKDGQGLANVTPASLIASALRMRPDRVLLAELRGAEAFDFLKLLTTGHAGSLTSFHAQSCALAIERFVLMAREHSQASQSDDATLVRLLHLTVDVIAHCKREGGRRLLSEIYFDPLNCIEMAHSRNLIDTDNS
ncbi:hypothetical protein WT49_03140 [Burkholderia territorii]|nr:hypothetical protein WT50_21505 [Burkholderia territorii]KWE38267.1 hypothetical protein WT51_30775 [Burkholderia territorii]KWE42911.1 hypothetical protein WT49_03140 [Burkholderia territorii]